MCSGGSTCQRGFEDALYIMTCHEWGEGLSRLEDGMLSDVGIKDTEVRRKRNQARRQR